MVAELGSIPIIACAIVDLPDPDSPTIATVEPGSTRKVASFTACTEPDCTLNSTDKFCTSSKLFKLLYPYLIRPHPTRRNLNWK